MTTFYYIVFFCMCGLNVNIVNCWKDTLYGVTIHVQEMSGKITVSNENNSLTIAFKEIVELAQNGRTEVGTRSSLPHRYKNFDYQLFSSDGPPQFVDVFSLDAQENITVFKYVYFNCINEFLLLFTYHFMFCYLQIECTIYCNNSVYLKFDLFSHV